MTILRTDKIAGLESVNAITGSVRFDQDGYLYVDAHDDWSLDGDFTIECWVKRDAATSSADKFTIGDSKESTGLEFYIGSSGTALKVYGNNGAIIEAAAGSYSAGVWHHLAVVRSGNTIKLYVDGTADNNTATNTSTFSGALRLGAEFFNNPSTPTVRSTFFMSNFRIVKGTALYTANFTVPTRQLENISGTSILCCQSSRDVAQEATGKTIVPTSTNLNSSVPYASTDVPDVGNDHTHGTVLEGNVEFPSLNYMTLPRGTTTQSNRGRGVFCGGRVTNDTQYINIQSGGNSVQFGEDTGAVETIEGFGLASSTRGVFGGGVSLSNKMEYVTIATTGNTTDFGDLTVGRRSGCGMSNQTRGVIAGGIAPGASDVMDYITIATTGNATDFGDLTAGTQEPAGINSPTRGVIAGGANPGVSNTIEYITIATTGDATNFGDLTVAQQAAGGSSSSTRGLIMGGMRPANNVTIDYITIASTGNAVDFGDLSVARAYNGTVSNSIRGVTAGGNANPVSLNTNSIEYVDIATTGNANDFGDLYIATRVIHGASDSHGGLSE